MLLNPYGAESGAVANRGAPRVPAWPSGPARWCAGAAAVPSRPVKPQLVGGGAAAVVERASGPRRRSVRPDLPIRTVPSVGLASGQFINLTLYPKE